MKEHKAACRLVVFERSAVAEHVWQVGHEIEWDEVEILDVATDLQERKVKESVYIRLAPKSPKGLSPKGLKMNRDEGKELSPPLDRERLEEEAYRQATPFERTVAERHQAVA